MQPSNNSTAAKVKNVLHQIEFNFLTQLPCMQVTPEHMTAVRFAAITPAELYDHPSTNLAEPTQIWALPVV